MKFFFFATHGPENPTRATLPFWMMKGALEAGHTVEMLFAADAPYLYDEKVVENVHGVGFPPLKELMAAAKTAGVKLYG